uniref:Uncharacterized protein n=1 Tax=Timema poppense TaxID=170557 RepID=A0A7R9CGQ5_TIMPO|nr:unnamed protein product [Timema poppensis]
MVHGAGRNDSFSSEQSSSMDVVNSAAGKKHKRSGSGKKSHHSSSQQQQGGQLAPSRHHHQQSFSSSEDELRSTPECTSCEEHDSEKETDGCPMTSDKRRKYEKGERPPVCLSVCQALNVKI